MMSSRQYVPPPHKRQNIRIAIAVVLIVIIFAVPPIRNGVRRGISAIGLSITRVTHGTGTWFSSLGTAVRSKYALENENTALSAQVEELNTKLASYNAVVSENADLKAAMGRNDSAPFTLAAVIAALQHSIYDTILIDGGTNVGLSLGQIVYANGVTPIGTITQVLSNSATVVLYSAPGQSLEARLSPENIDITLVGRGGGNFTATIPHDVSVTSGSVVVTKDINPYTLALFQKITSDQRDPFQTLLLAAPVNVNQLAYVEVRQDTPELAPVLKSKTTDTKTTSGTH